jgi:tryptophanyl-tRNA synthetase
VVRSFNHRYETDILVEPQAKVTQIPKVLGLDGERKMSKSLDNHIELASTSEETEKRVMSMVTDPQRMRRDDPGNPDICNVFTLHKIFTSQEEVEEINQECRQAGIGCVDCKRKLAANLNQYLTPFRDKREKLAKNSDIVDDVLRDGAKRARVIAGETMSEVREAIGFFGSGE